jgi:hypothetical protein
MAIKRPDIYEHNNPLNSIVDSDFVRGGARTAVNNLAELYQIGSGANDKVDQLKAYSTKVYVISENKFYILTDLANRGNEDGWIKESYLSPEDSGVYYPASNPSGFISGIPDIVYTTGDQNISGKKTFFDDLSSLSSFEVGSDEISPTLYIKGKRVGINKGSDPQFNLDVSGSSHFTERPFVNGTGVLLSGEIAELPNTIVYTTGDQTISGTKSFAGNVFGSGFLQKDQFDNIYGINPLSGEQFGHLAGLPFFASNQEVMRLYSGGNIAFDDFTNMPGARLNPNYKVIHFASPERTGATIMSFASKGLHTCFLGNNSGQFILGYERPSSTVSGLHNDLGWVFKSDLLYTNTNIFLSGRNVFFIDHLSGNLSGLGSFIASDGNRSLDWNARGLSGDWKISETLQVGTGATAFYVSEDGKVGISNENPQAQLDVSGLAIFSQRPSVSGKEVLLSGDIQSFFVTGVSNVVYTTGDQTINGKKSFVNTTDYTVSKFEGPAGFPLEIVSSDENLSAGYGSSSYAIGVGASGFVVKYSPSENDWGRPILISESDGTVVFPSSTIEFSQSVSAPNLYTNDNPSGFITGLSNVVYTTGDQTISGVKNFNVAGTAAFVPVSNLFAPNNTGEGHETFIRVGIKDEENPYSSAQFGYKYYSGEGGSMDDRAMISLYGADGLFQLDRNSWIINQEGERIINLLGRNLNEGWTFDSRPQVNTTGVMLVGEALGLSSESYVIAKPGDDLAAKYAEAKVLTPKNQAKTATNRASLIILPGEYSLSSELEIDAEFVDLIGLGAQVQSPAVFVSNNTLNVTANDVRVSGISVGTQQFKIGDNKPLQVFENCKGGEASFSNNSATSGRFFGCVGGTASFGNAAAGYYFNCLADLDSFGETGGEMSGQIISSKVISGGFPTPSGSGIIRFCLDGDNNIVNADAP